MAGSSKFEAEIAEAHRAFPTVPTYVIKAVIATESAFDPEAYNPEVGSKYGPSRGLMQLTMPTAKALGYGGTAANLFLPAINIYYGTKLLADNYARLGDWAKAVSMYNGGYRPSIGFGETVKVSGVRCGGRVVPVGEFCNQRHVDRFLDYAQRFALAERQEPETPAPTHKAGLGFWGLLALAGAWLAGLLSSKGVE